MSCYDFPVYVIHEDGCAYQRGGVCHPKPSSEAPDDVVRDYVHVLNIRRGLMPDDMGLYEVPKPGGTSIDPHTGKVIT